MLALFLATALFLPTTEAKVEDPARLVPADTLIYFGSTGLQAGFEASRNTAMAKILGESEVKAFFAEPLGAANQVIRQGIGMVQGQLAEAQQAAQELGVGMTLDENQTFLSIDAGSPPPIGQLFVALTHIGMPDGSAGGPPVPEVGVALGVQLLSPPLVSMAQSLWAGIPFPDANSSHAGVSYLAKQSPFATLCLATLGDLVVITTSTKALHGIIERWNGAAGAGPSLASSSEYRAAIDSSGGLIAGGSSYFVRAAPLASLARMALAMGLPQSGEFTDDQVGKILKAYDSLGLGAIELIGGVSAVGTDGLIYGTTVASIDSAATGLASKLARPGKPVDVSVFSQIPADALSASIASLGTQFVDVYDFCMTLMKDIEPEAAAEMEGALGALLGGRDLRTDLLGNINGRMLSYTVPGQGLMGTPDTVMSAGVRDGDAFVGVLGALLAAVSQESGMPLSLKPGDHEGQAYHRIDLSATPVGMMMQPAFAIRDGEIVFSTSERQLKTVLNGTVSGKSLWDVKELATFAKSLAAQGDVTSVSFTDVRSSFGNGYQQMTGLAAMIPGLSDLPMDMSKLPAEGTISRHLSYSFAGGYHTESGMDVVRTVSQFSNSDFLPLLLIGGAIAAGQKMGITTEELVAELDPVEKANEDLRELKASVTVFKISEAGYPTSLEDLLRPLGDFPNGAYQHASLPVDPWGNSYMFAMETHPKKNKLLPKLWSAGPNGIDESGDGDDILKF